MRAISVISKRAVKWKDRCVSQVSFKFHSQSVNHHLLPKGLQEATSKRLHHITAAAIMKSVQHVMC